MKIVNRTEFRKLPPGTLYSKYQPCVFDALCIKGDDSPPNDWYVQQIADSIQCSGSDEFSAKLERAQYLGESLAMEFDCEGRDGCYENDQLFAVWERADVVALIVRLQATLAR